jgi:hypothetical protein
MRLPSRAKRKPGNYGAAAHHLMLEAVKTFNAAALNAKIPKWQDIVTSCYHASEYEARNVFAFQRQITALVAPIKSLKLHLA